MQPSPYITLSDEVQTALQEQRPVVALESTVIAHGLPYPANIEVAQSMESAIRAEGAIPATIGIHNGTIKIGLNLDEITRLGTAQQDLTSLVDFEAHLSGKTQFLQDAVLGFINTQQNDIFTRPRHCLGRLAHIAGPNQHRLDLDHRSKAATFDVKMWRHMVVRVNRNLAICKTADGRHRGPLL